MPLAALTAWQALVDTGRLQPGQRVLVHSAAGEVGHFAVEFAKHLGAHEVATASGGRLDGLTRAGRGPGRGLQRRSLRSHRARHGPRARPGRRRPRPHQHRPGLVAVGYPIVHGARVVGGFGLSGGTAAQDQQVAETAVGGLGFDIPA